MAASRVNPRHNLIRTAIDLADYLRVINRDEFLKIMTAARNEYAAPAESWIWFLLVNRERVPFVDSMIQKMVASDNPQAITAIVSEVFSIGGWDETSMNTTLMRSLVKKIPNYEE